MCSSSPPPPAAVAPAPAPPPLPATQSNVSNVSASQSPTRSAEDSPRMGGRRAKENSRFANRETPNTRRADAGGLTM